MELRLVLPGVACASLVALNAAAQYPTAAPGPARQPAPTPVNAPAAASHTVVILTEMTGDPAIDAQLRAATDGILQRIRARGYEMHSPAAVGAAMPANPHPANLRAAVGAELLVRAAVRHRDRDRAVLNVTVLSALGQRTQDLTLTTPEISTAVPAAADALIPPPGTAVAQPGALAPLPVAQQPAPASVDRAVLRDGSIVEGKIIQAVPGSFIVIATADGRQRMITWDRIAEVQASGGAPGAAQAQATAPSAASQGAWDRRGGSILTFDVQVMLTGMLDSVTTHVDKKFTSGETMHWTGTGSAGGGGGGLGLHLGYLYLGAPDISKGSTWAGFRAMTGFEFAYVAYGARTDAVIQAGLKNKDQSIIEGSATGGDTAWTSSSVKMIPLSLGGQFGFGKFWGDTRWSGTMLGIDWRPTWYHSKPGDREASSGINPAGMALTFDVGSLEPAGKPESNFRMSLTWLPPVAAHPTVLSLGFGAAWY